MVSFSVFLFTCRGPGTTGVTGHLLLPATVDCRDDAEAELLHRVLIDVNVNALEFKLSPAYIIYMSARHKLLSNQNSPASLQQVASLTSKVTDIIYQIIQVRYSLQCCSPNKSRCYINFISDTILFHNLMYLAIKRLTFLTSGFEVRQWWRTK